MLSCRAARAAAAAPCAALQDKSKPRRQRCRVAPRAAVVGIDLGTTNSCIAVIDRETGEPRLVRNRKGDATTPSVVAYRPRGSDETTKGDAGGSNETGGTVEAAGEGGAATPQGDVEVLVGELARRQAAANPLNTFYSAKRFMGRQFSEREARAAARAMPYEVVEAAEEGSKQDDGDKDSGKGGGKGGGWSALQCPALDRALLPEEIGAELLRSLLADAERDTGEPITKAVIGVPAYFSDEAVAATERAGALAGLETVRTIREPVAAALAYGFRPDMPEEVILVFDLGGGTFDVSILVVGGGIAETLSTGGDTALGGDDLDARIAEHVVKALGPKLGAKARADPVAMHRLASTAEASRKALSDHNAVTMRLPFLVEGDEGPVGVEERLTRNLLEGLCQDEMRRLRMPVETCFEQAGMELEPIRQENERRERDAKRNKRDKRQAKGKGRGKPAASLVTTMTEDGKLIDEEYMAVTQVVMVGGASRTPCVQRVVRHCTGIEPAFPINPDEAVALGAAVRAGMNEGLVEGLQAVDPWQAALINALAKEGMLPTAPINP